MSSTLNSFAQSLRGKDSFGTSSHIFAALFTVTSFTLHIVQSYFSTPVANVKYIPATPSAQPPIAATPTTTRPLTPTRSTNFVDSSPGVSYVLLTLILVLIGILVGAVSTYARTKDNSTVTPHASSSSRKQERERDPPPKGPPQQDEEPSKDTEEREDSNGEEREDGGGDPDNEAGEETNGEQGTANDSAGIGGGSPGGDPNDPSGGSNVDDIPPPPFEPDPWDVLALTLLYIFAVASIVPRALHKRLNVLVKHLCTSAISVRTKAGGFVERAFQHVDDSFSWIDGLRVSVEMDTADPNTGTGIGKFGNTTTTPVMPKLNVMDDGQHEVKSTLNLIEGLLSPISPQLSQVSSSIPLQASKLPEPIVQALPLPTLEPSIEPIVQALPLPTPEPTIEPIVQALPLPTSEPSAILPPEPFVIQPDTSTIEAESQLLRIVRAISGWATVALLIRRVAREWRQRRNMVTTRTAQQQPEVEIETEAEDEGEDEDEGTTAVEHSNNSVTCDILDEQRDERENNEDEEVETHQPSDILGTSFVTAQDLSVTVHTEESNHEDRPVPPTITVSPSFSVPNTPEQATAFPSGTPSFAGVLTSSTLRLTRAQEAESRPASPPPIRVVHSDPNTPEPITTFPNGTPSFAGVLTSSTLRPSHARQLESESGAGPSVTQSTLPASGPTNTLSFADTATPFSFSFQSPRRTNTSADNAFRITSTPGPSTQYLSAHDVSFSLSPVLLRKRRRLDEAGKIAIRIATPSFNGVTSSSPAVGHNRRWFGDEIGTPTRDVSRSMLSLSESHRWPTTPKSSIISTNITFSTTFPSFSSVFCSPAVQRNRRRHVEETKKTSLADRDFLRSIVPFRTDQGSNLSETEDQPGYVVEDDYEDKVEEEYAIDGEDKEISEEQAQEAEMEQVHEEDLGEKEMDIEEDDHSIIYDFETELESEQAELTPRPTPGASTDIVPEEGNSFTSEGDQTVLDPQIIAQGAAEMLRLLQEDMEREKAAKEEAAREEAMRKEVMRERRIGKMRSRENPESSRMRRETIDGAQRKYVGPLQALKRGVLEEEGFGRTGGFAQPEAGSSKHSDSNWLSAHERMIEEVAKMRELVVKAYASQHCDEEEIDRLTLWHLGLGNI